MEVIFFDLLAFAPEVILLIASLLALITGLIIKKQAAPYLILFIGFFLAFCQMNLTADLEWGNNFNNSLFRNDLSDFFRSLLLLVGIIVLILLSQSPLPYETAVLMTISTFALMLLVASNDFITLYLTMELSGLCLYIMMASKKNSQPGTEVAIKYLIVAAFISVIFLLGITTFSSLQGTFSYNFTRSFFDFQPLLSISLLFILTAFLFKLGAAPLHLLLPDVYQGAPWQVVVFFATSSKIAAFAILMKFLYLFKDLFDFKQLLTVVGIASIILGGLAAIRQKNIKRLLAYSSVSNLGLVLLVISLQTPNSLATGLFYFLIYSLLLFLPAFILIGIIGNQRSHITLDDLAEVRQTNPFSLFFLNIMAFALAGLPPFAGFFGKLYLLVELIANEAWYSLFFFLLGAVFSLVYSMQIIRASYFEGGQQVLIRGSYPWPTREIFIFIILGIINLSLALYSSELLSWLMKSL